MKSRNRLASLKSLVPMAVRYRLMELRGRGLYSGYADAHRCIFIHIPKTAGTSIAHALFHSGSRHVPCTEYERANPRKFRTYFKFAFVRNPWDRLFSAYHFLKAGGMGDVDRIWAQANLARYRNFEQFVYEWVSETNINSWVHFRPQIDFISDASGHIAMDFIGRMERIDTDFESICRQVGINASLPRLNQTDKVHYSEAYTTEMIEIVRKSYERDISLLNYSFTSH